ncbi:chemotaxis protein CheL [Bradyrhizobium sp. SSBR45G]|uniref:flagellar assembly peptidoglycan hydrolase FlgJ n=1 Tax=unclassified Bradyrhizobium TaxID=2631580 RepID=UPI002342B2F4|nr:MULTISPECIES: flagellar assembly peptidoglycan hydrolase FlgJ [unclassified Bradyrhizobium]GLH79641.1 chemotaxis protein CheL [Bradyrhizobium sp. SSBR45G]GLH86964.1 chemotaxis protein CheL [Bradyrhizobium sp. SSBR45R]
MATSFVDSYNGRVALSMPHAAAVTAPRADLDLADALTKVSPKAQAKAKATATDFEAMFLNSMFSQMMSGVKGDGPFGDTPGTGVWRSMLTEQYSKNFAKAGGVGISNDVFRTLILQQAKSSSSSSSSSTSQASTQAAP